jgi:hypothetical protein
MLLGENRGRNIDKCEACELMPATVVEPCDDEANPYRVCELCHKRLIARALRPIEWYNLAKHHSWSKFLLHDDFYDEDGNASQPEDDVVDASLYKAPLLSDVSKDPEALLDYSITRWHLDKAVKDAWRVVPSLSVLEVISIRFTCTHNLNIRSVCLEIAAITLGKEGADFIRYCWSKYPAADLISLAQASAACLPFREGFDRVVNALDVIDSSHKHKLICALSYFHSTEALDWIERTIFEPITENWGYLAAASDIDWPRVKAWFDSGRPLSLVAIDALWSIVRPMPPFLRDYRPILRDRPDRQTYSTVLTKYMEIDPVPRVQQRIKKLLDYEGSLTTIVSY